MSDLISRQAAIDALMKRDKELRNINWYDKPFAEGECKGIDYALEIVNALPSVQPTQSNAYNALKTLDCIDRQAAIEKLISNLTYMHTFGADRSIDLIEELPAIQPEIIRCKDCKHKHLENMVWTCPFGLPGGKNFFCGYGAEPYKGEQE